MKKRKWFVFIVTFATLMTVNLIISINLDESFLSFEFNGAEVVASVPEDGLSCNDLSNCKNGASCSGPGQMIGPCTFTCDSGPKVECGEK